MAEKTHFNVILFWLIVEEEVLCLSYWPLFIIRSICHVKLKENNKNMLNSQLKND